MPQTVERAIEHLRSDDILLYASDYPHWQFDGDAAMPAGISPALRRKIAIDNPLATYATAQGGRAMNIEVRAKDRTQQTKLRSSTATSTRG